MNGILKTGLSAVLIVFILKFALKLASKTFSALIALAVLIILIGVFQQVRNQ
ncbi:MAG: hypothetical protein Q4Q07_03555 [Tissierellia bacterium]|nr:hypothetical protein [Tissierellia bacterium]